MQFTLVSTVFNEAKRIDQTIDDLAKQVLQPDEIIITDAGSNDGTYEILKKWQAASSIPIIILQKVRCNVAEGRNMAIKAAKHPIIASMDFGCRYHPKWLESIITPFSDPQVMVVGGAFSVQEEEIETISAKAAYVLFNGYNINADLEGFIPSSRSIAYRKEVYDNVGGYLEWLTLAADDLVFGMMVKKKGYDIFRVNKSYAFWMRHKTAKAYAKEGYRYGLGDGEARVQFEKFKKRLLGKIYRVAFFADILFILLGLIFVNKLSIIPVILAFVLAFSLRFYIGYFNNWKHLRSNKYDIFTLLYSFYLVEKTSTSYIKGYIKGYYYSSALQKREAIQLNKLLEA